MEISVIKLLVEKVAIGVLIGVLVQMVFFLVNRLYNLVKRPIRIGFYKLLTRAIKSIQQRQDITSSELLYFYEDLEELLGDFIEKYKRLSRKTPAPTRREFFCRFVIDVFGLVRALVTTALLRFLGLDEVPRA